MKPLPEPKVITTLRTIGTIHSEVKERKKMPPMGAPATIEILPEFADGLLRLEKHSHVWVLAWLDRADRDLLQVVPRGVSAEEPEALHGVFAVRSPARPNTIGLTVTKLLGIRGRQIDTEFLDFLDGTPVVDLKPYFGSRDMVFSAANAQIGRPANRAALQESLLRQATNFHGELCADLALAVRIVAHFQFEVLGMREPRSWKVTVPLGRPCMADALMGTTKTSPGRGTLLTGAVARVVFEHEGAIHEYTIPSSPPGTPEAILSLSDDRLFQIAIQKRP